MWEMRKLAAGAKPAAISNLIGAKPKIRLHDEATHFWVDLLTVRSDAVGGPRPKAGSEPSRFSIPSDRKVQSAP